jgi:hypothetical protein
MLHLPRVVEEKEKLMVSETVTVRVRVTAKVQVRDLVTATVKHQVTTHPRPLCGCQMPCGFGCPLLSPDSPGSQVAL